LIQTPEEDDSLCVHCANREECSEHHMMCVDYEPTEKPADGEQPL